jgi:hypothetical protein
MLAESELELSGLLVPLVSAVAFGEAGMNPTFSPNADPAVIWWFQSPIAAAIFPPSVAFRVRPQPKCDVLTL